MREAVFVSAVRSGVGKVGGGLAPFTAVGAGGTGSTGSGEESQSGSVRN